MRLLAPPTRLQMPRRVQLLVALAAALQILFLSSPRAFAGTYDVYSCRLPDGTRIPASGWSGFGGTARSNQCTSTGGLTARFADAPILAAADVSPLSATSGGWVFEAPSGTSIAGFEVQRAAFVLSGPRTASSMPSWRTTTRRLISGHRQREESQTASDASGQRTTRRARASARFPGSPTPTTCTGGVVYTVPGYTWGRCARAPGRAARHARMGLRQT